MSGQRRFKVPEAPEKVEAEKEINNKPVEVNNTISVV
jgi:hypothetical protein